MKNILFTVLCIGVMIIGLPARPALDQEFDAVIIAERVLETDGRSIAELKTAVLDAIEEQGFHVPQKEKTGNVVIARARFSELETPGHMSRWSARTSSRFHRDEYYLIVDLSHSGAIKCTMARRERRIPDKIGERLLECFVTDLNSRL